MTRHPKQPRDEWDFVPNGNDQAVLPRPRAAEDESMHLQARSAPTPATDPGRSDVAVDTNDQCSATNSGP
jgi:hypothetical protein